ncbi:MAG: hypothetical protein GX051_03615 [Clostridiales bacterium]|nr:hypothetical protein [Clostridiales bacterium]
MPNHVSNTITFECDEKRLKEILDAIKYESDAEVEHTGIGTLDFNKIIPMPKSLEIEAGSSTDRGLKAYKDFISVFTFCLTAPPETVTWQRFKTTSIQALWT